MDPRTRLKALSSRRRRCMMDDIVRKLGERVGPKDNEEAATMATTVRVKSMVLSDLMSEMSRKKIAIDLFGDLAGDTLELLDVLNDPAVIELLTAQ